MGKLLYFTGPTLLDLPPERVLQAAVEAKYTHVLVIGIQPDGTTVLTSTSSDLPFNLWHTERARQVILEAQ